jgi:hypothetical protein
MKNVGRVENETQAIRLGDISLNESHYPFINSWPFVIAMKNNPRDGQKCRARSSAGFV